MNRRVFLGGLAVTASRFAGASGQQAYHVQENVEFRREPVSLKLDAHVPSGKGPFPAVILVHGGGWTAGSKTVNFVRPLFEPLDRTGFTWFTIDYRLAPQYPYPAAVEDVEQAIQFVKQHASEYKADPKRIALMGESAGAHLVDLVGARNRTPSDVAAVVSFYGPIDMVKFCESFTAKPPDGPFRDFFGISEWNARATSLLRESSPSTYLGPQTPPFLFIHGTKDEMVPYEQSTLAVKLFRKKKIPCDLISVEGGVHGVMNWEKDPKLQGYKPQMIAWLQQHLGGVHT